MRTKVGLGPVIRRLRQRAALSQEELAHRAGIHHTHLSQLERGLKSPTVETLTKLAKALGTAPSKMLRQSERDKN